VFILLAWAVFYPFKKNFLWSEYLPVRCMPTAPAGQAGMQTGGQGH